MSDYTPDEDAVAVVWLAQYDLGDAGAGKTMRREGEESWGRFIDKVKADALREAADDAQADPTFRDPLRLRSDWLRVRADRIEGEA